MPKTDPQETLPLPDPRSFGPVYAFIDFANVKKWDEQLWPEDHRRGIRTRVSFEKLRELCDNLNATKRFFYFGYIPFTYDATQHERSHNLLARAEKQGFTIKTKETKFIQALDEDGTFKEMIPKCNFDVEMTMDMLSTQDSYNTLLLFSGDGDFEPPLQTLKANGKRIIVICTTESMSKELRRTSDIFIPAETLSGVLR